MSLYKQILMEHFRNPKYKYEQGNSEKKIDGVNPSCGDNITLFFNRDYDKVTNLSYTGNGCAISMASADIMCEIFQGDFNKKVILDFISMIEGNNISFSQKLEKLNIFQELQQFPARRNCALLPWKTLLEAIN